MGNERLSGDWWGVRNRLADCGIDVGVSLLTVYQHNAMGGFETHNAHRITGSADYDFIFDLDKLNIWPEGIVYLYAESTWGDDIGPETVGNLFGLNGDAVGDEAVLVREAYYEQRFLDRKIRWRAGRLDLTAELDTNAYADDENTQFLNPALVDGQNVPIPEYGFGTLVSVQPVDWFYTSLAAADA